MKCLFAIPKSASGRVQAACEEYARELEAWSSTAAALADRLASLVDELGSGQLRLADDDWSGLRSQLEASGQELALAEIFWTVQDARNVADAIEALGAKETSRGQAVRSWLRAEVGRGSSVVALTR